MVRDFTPVTQINSVPNILVVNPSIPAHSVRDLITLAKAKPGQLNYASAGAGTSPHLATELFKTMAGIDMTHIPYKGIPPAVTDVIAGRVSMLMTTTISAGPHVKSGKLRALAVTSPKRTALAPDLPAVSETLPGFESVTWFGIYGPKGMAADLAGKVNQAVNAALADADVKERFARLGAEPIGGTSQAFADMVKADNAKWKKIISERKITAE